MSELHSLDTIGRFDDRAADYVKYRPTYPSAAIDTILDGIGPPSRMLAADERHAGPDGSVSLVSETEVYLSNHV